ncbi:unnamed protein product [Spodoptera littoralis]|uniref:Uncharacterized protein n=1 Tax=Spodoptera littoralis TaxID=7109 RepID=A0A9P0HYQ8_SPOLI|nr:unnamed protein product [Spodoptera littoralis]CAH1636995.1 unnamed protein product [Spodoptera littoralis]
MLSFDVDNVFIRKWLVSLFVVGTRTPTDQFARQTDDTGVAVTAFWANWATSDETFGLSSSYIFDRSSHLYACLNIYIMTTICLINTTNRAYKGIMIKSNS